MSLEKRSDARRMLQLAPVREPRNSDLSNDESLSSHDPDEVPGAHHVPPPARKNPRTDQMRRNGAYDSYASGLHEASVDVPTVVATTVKATQVVNEEALRKRLADAEAQLRAKEEELKRMNDAASTLAGSVAGSTIADEEFARHRILQRDEIKTGTLLGKGYFNAVLKVKAINLDEQSYRWVPREHIQQRVDLVNLSKSTKLSIKTIDIIQSHDLKNKKLAAKRIMYEARTLTKFDKHANIIKVVGMASLDVLDENFFFLMRRVDYTLYDWVSKTWNRFQRGKPKFLSQQVKAATDVASGLDYLHSLNIMFGDLKPENIGYASYDGNWKLCNFSKVQSMSRKNMNVERRPYDMKLCSKSVYHGTPPYAAPEIKKKLPCNISVDTFAFAIVLWEISTVKICEGRESELEAMVLSEMKEKGAQWQPPEFYDDFPLAVKEIVQQCWKIDPHDRPCMKDVHAKLRELQGFLLKML